MRRLVASCRSVESTYRSMTHFADQIQSCTAGILKHEQIAHGTMRLRVSLPASMCQAAPGQFFMLRDLHSTDPLIGRALALYDCSTAEGWIEVVYVVKGKFTTSICRLRPGQSIGIWGPLGNSFDDSPTRHLIMVAGGIGQTPFLSLAKEATGKQRFGNRRFGYASQLTFCYGARSEIYLADVAAFERAGAEVRIATEDGSVGPPQRVTQLLQQVMEEQRLPTDTRIVCCGPEPMMKAVSQIAKDNAIGCQVSLETPMACGIGICFTCVARVGTCDQWDYQRTCVEGPIFDAESIVW